MEELACRLQMAPLLGRHVVLPAVLFIAGAING
jgi:hypothetical protein